MRVVMPLETLLKRDRIVIALGLVVIAALAWIYTVHLAAGMANGDMAHVVSRMTLPQVEPWTAVDFLLMLVMWAVMMVAMMLPSAAPMILLHATISRKRHQDRRPYLPTALLVAAYLVVWGGFALIATTANWVLHTQGLMTFMMDRAPPLVAGSLVLTAGLFQWTPLKHACLSRCRSPLAFLITEWREGRRGAFVMGLRHGFFCVLCCWALT